MVGEPAHGTDSGLGRRDRGRRAFASARREPPATARTAIRRAPISGAHCTAASSSTQSGKPRLGYVIRFNPDAGTSGIKRVASAGFKVASSSDFRAASAVPNDLGGADVQYFERFGLAVVRESADRVDPMISAAVEARTIVGARPERQFRALGMPSDAGEGDDVSVELATDAALSRDYVRGYRDAVVAMAERLLGGELAGVEGSEVVTPMVGAGVTWGLNAIKLPLAKLTGAGIKVAILDTGIDDSHPDFRGRAVVKKLFASKSLPNDTHGHGTHVTGTACGPRTPSRAAVPRYGVACEAEIYSGKVLGDDGFGTERSILAGMDWAVDQGCHVINMSLGARVRPGEKPDDDYEHVGQVCLDSGTLVVAAAGNESKRHQGLIAPIGAPANCRSILAVGAVDRAFRPALFSCGGINLGQEVDIAAPGVDVISCVPGGGYRAMNGTSMASPHVAGIAALIAQSDKKYRGWALWARVLQLVAPIKQPPRDVGKGLAQAPF